MKKTLLAALCLFSFASFAVEPLEMDVDISSEFAALDLLEQAVEANPNLDFETVKTSNAHLIEGVAIIHESSVSNAAEPMPFLGAFWWGCCLSLIGLVLVYFITDNDREQVKSALLGCVIGTILFGLTGILTFF